jgi:dTDP-4-dehydrorhamnose 3,5-epimerase-like enzyme
MSNFEFIDLAMPGDTACKCTKEYPPKYDREIASNHPVVAIDWPLCKLFFFNKNSRHLLLNNAEYDFVIHEA